MFVWLNLQDKFTTRELYFFLLFFQPFVVKWIGDEINEDQMKNPEFCIMPFSLYNDNNIFDKKRKHEEKFTTLNLLKRDWTYNQFGSIKKMKHWKYPCKAKIRKSFIFFPFSNSFPGFLAQKD